MHSFFFGGGKGASAIIKDLIENDIMETFHWLPQDIDKIPYKRLQRILLIKKHKNATVQAKAHTEKIKRDFYSSARGQSKRFVKEV